MIAHSEIEYIRRLLQAMGDDGSYYAAHWTADTNVYRLLQVYAGEVASGSAEVVQTYDDTFLSTCRADNLYYNFGTYVGPGRFYEQLVEADTYSVADGSWIGYRKQLRFLWDAAFLGASYDAMDRVGHAYFGMGLLLEPYREVKRWRLRTVSGSVTAITATGFTDAVQDWRPGYWAEGLVEFGAGDGTQTLRVRGNTADTIEWYDPPTGVEVGAEYKLGFSKLGTGSKLYSAEMKAKGCKAYCWPQPTADEARITAFKESVDEVKPAGTVVRWASGSGYAAETSYDQFIQWTSGSTAFVPQADGSIINVAAVVPTPEVSTGIATEVTATAAVVEGYVRPGTADVTVYFEYGETTAYGYTSSGQVVSASNDISSFQATLSFLSDSTTYQYRAVASNGVATSYGVAKEFVTLDAATLSTVSLVHFNEPEGATVFTDSARAPARGYVMTSSGVDTVDTTLSEASVVSSVTTNSTYFRPVISAPHLYVPTTAGFEVFDISDRDQPTRVGVYYSTHLGLSAHLTSARLEVSGDYVYLAVAGYYGDSSGANRYDAIGLEIVDATIKASPVLVGQLKTIVVDTPSLQKYTGVALNYLPSWVPSAEVTVAYVIYDHSLVGVDVTTPSSPTASWTTTGTPIGYDLVYLDQLYMAVGASGVAIYNPNDGTPYSVIVTGGVAKALRTNELTDSRGHICVAATNRVVVVGTDTTIYANYPFTGVTELSWSVYGSTPWSTALSSYLCVVDSVTGMSVLDITDVGTEPWPKTSPIVVSAYPSGGVSAVFIEPERAWTSDGYDALGLPRTTETTYVFGPASVRCGDEFGLSGYVVAPYSEDFMFGSGDFTISAQVRLSQLDSSSHIFGIDHEKDGWGFSQFFCYVNDTGTNIIFELVILGTQVALYSFALPTIQVDSWYHVELVRSGPDMYCFINGNVLEASVTVGIGDTDITFPALDPDNTYDWAEVWSASVPAAQEAYMDEFRVLKGYAAHTENFTPPTEPYTM